MKQSTLKYSDNKPYSQTVVSNQIIRIFTQDINSDDLVWHRDREDRQIDVVGDSDWMFQFDNQLPVILQGTIFIPKDTYHRVIKGTADLKIKITQYT